MKTSTENDAVQFMVDYKGESCLVSPIQVTATMISKIRSLIQREGFDKVNDLVISVPSYYTE